MWYCLRKDKQTKPHHSPGFPLGSYHDFFCTSSGFLKKLPKKKWTSNSSRTLQSEFHFYVSCCKLRATSFSKAFCVALFSKPENFWLSEADPWPLLAGTISICAAHKEIQMPTHFAQPPPLVPKAWGRTGVTFRHSEPGLMAREVISCSVQAGSEPRWRANRYLLLQINTKLR